MASRIVVVIYDPNDSIAQSGVNIATKPFESIQNIITHLTKGLAGMKPMSIQVTVRDTDPGVSTSGAGSTQQTYSFL